MKLFLDTAIIEEIDSRLSSGVISGVTTNPTLIKKSGKDPDDIYAAVSYTHLTLPTKA